MSRCIIQTEIPYWLKFITSLSPIVITLVIGGIAAYIAYQQYIINRNKFRFELFEKRLSSYQSLLDFLFEIETNGRTGVKLRALSRHYYA
jgi:hypothetical protein